MLTLRRLLSAVDLGSEGGFRHEVLATDSPRLSDARTGPRRPAIDYARWRNFGKNYQYGSSRRVSFTARRRGRCWLGPTFPALRGVRWSSGGRRLRTRRPAGRDSGRSRRRRDGGTLGTQAQSCEPVSPHPSAYCSRILRTRGGMVMAVGGALGSSRSCVHTKPQAQHRKYSTASDSTSSARPGFPQSGHGLSGMRTHGLLP